MPESLSELEGAVLGLIWRDGPMTAYAVRREFVASSTSFFNGSAGSIYPLVRRLEAAGLIRSRDRRGDGRATKELAATKAGARALRAWIGPPIDDRWAGATLDPIRSRVQFWQWMSAPEKRGFLDAAESALERELAREKETLRSIGADGAVEVRLVTESVIGIAKARLKWVRSLRNQATR